MQHFADRLAEAQRRKRSAVLWNALPRSSGSRRFRSSGSSAGSSRSTCCSRYLNLQVANVESALAEIGNGEVVGSSRAAISGVTGGPATSPS